MAEAPRRAADRVRLLFLLLWEGAVHLTGIKEYLLPPPSKVWTEFLKRYPTVMDGAPSSPRRRSSPAICSPFGSAFRSALTVAYSRFVEHAIYPVVVFLQIISKDRDRAAVHHLVRLRLYAQAAAVFLLSFCPDRGREHRGLQVGRSNILDFARTHRAERMEDVSPKSGCRRRCRISSPG